MGIENDSLSKIEIMNINYSKVGRKKESVLNETQKFYRVSIRRERRVKNSMQMLCHVEKYHPFGQGNQFRTLNTYPKLISSSD